MKYGYTHPESDKPSMSINCKTIWGGINFKKPNVC